MKICVLLLSVLLVAQTAEAASRRKPMKPRSESYGSEEPRSAPSHSMGGSGGGQRMAGCGLGSMVIENNDKWSQVGAAFLNGTGMQTFGISFGTSNCTEDGVAMASKEKEAFVEANLADLKQDIAKGEGEYLSALSSLYGCKGAAFGKAMHKNQNKLLSVNASEATSAIDAVVVSEALSCQG